MTFEPVMPVWLLIIIAVVLTGVRMTALYRCWCAPGPAATGRWYCAGAA